MFLHPTIFWLGLSLIAAPILIHLLNRRRYRVVPWAAMRFLLEAARRNRRRVQFEQWLLLAMRCLAVLLLALAVSRYTGCSNAPLPVIARGSSALHVFVLDDSVSMGQKLADTTAFSKAANDLVEMIAQLPPSDRLAILLSSEDGRTLLVDPAQTPNGEVLANRLKALRPSDTATQFDGTLKEAREILSATSSAKRLYILSDFRAVDYAAGKADAIRPLLQAMQQEKSRIVLLNYGAPPTANLSLEELSVADKLSLANQPLRVQVSVRNNGPTRAENVSLRLTARGPDGQELQLPPRLIDSIEPGQARQVQASVEFPAIRGRDARDTSSTAAPGGARILAELPSDSLPGDNRAYLSTELRAARKVLIVEGRPEAANPEDAEGFYLASALDPTADGRYGNNVQGVSFEKAGEVELADYDAVILAGVSELPPSSVKRLEEYVRGGGGLAIFTASRLNMEFYRALYADGAGLMPVLLDVPDAGASAGESARAEAPFARLAGDSIAADAILRSFQGKNAAFTQFVRFYGYSPVKQVANSSRVLAEFQAASGSRSPAIVQKNFGQGASSGSVVAILSSCDQSWSNWPKDYTFVTFANDLIDAICRREGSRDGRVGQPIVLPAPPDLRKALLQTPAFPAQDEVALLPQDRAAQATLTYEPTLQAGFYQLQLQAASGGRTVDFARNIDPAEGQLAVISPAELKQTLGVELEYIDKLQSQESVQAAEQKEYWKAALAALLALLAAEVFLGQRFGHYR